MPLPPSGGVVPPAALGTGAMAYGGLPLTTMATVNGVPQLVAVLPQQYVLQPGMAPPGVYPGVPPYGAAMPTVSMPPSGYGARGWMQGAAPIGAAQAAPLGSAGGKRGDGGAEARLPKKLVCRGREVRTVEEAAAMGCILELAYDQNGCRFLQARADPPGPAAPPARPNAPSPAHRPVAASRRARGLHRRAPPSLPRRRTSSTSARAPTST